MSTSIDYSNKTFAIVDSSERYFWTVFHIFVLLSSFIGDTLILYASFQRNAFRLNKFIVVVIQYMAVYDILYTIFWVLPVAISLIANSEILGEALCNAQDYLSTVIGFEIMFLTPVLTASKLFFLKCPFRSGILTKRRAHTVCWLSVIPCMSFTVSRLVIDDIKFDYRIYGCDHKYTADTWRILEPIFAVIGLYLPVLSVICTTIPTLKYLYAASKSARRVQGSIPWQGAVTVTLTAIVYCISYLPMSFYYIGRNFSNFFELRFYRIAVFAVAINVMANFYIYALTIRSFRRFVLSTIISLSLTMSGGRRSSPAATGIFKTILTYMIYNLCHFHSLL